MKRYGIHLYALPVLAVGLLWGVSSLPALSLTLPDPLNLELEVAQTATSDQILVSAQQLAYRQLNAAFQSDRQRQTVTVYVSVAHNGESVPLLAVTIDRPTWQQKPDLTAYTRYFKTAIALLNLPTAGSANWTTASTPTFIESGVVRYPGPNPSHAALDEYLKQLWHQETGR